jgi:phage regulator Rha-like protein
MDTSKLSWKAAQAAHAAKFTPAQAPKQARLDLTPPAKRTHAEKREVIASAYGATEETLQTLRAEKREAAAQAILAEAQAAIDKEKLDAAAVAPKGADKSVHPLSGPTTGRLPTNYVPQMQAYPAVVPNGVPTMTSKEIAELTGKEHKNVLADIRTMLDQLGKAAADFSATATVDGPNGSRRAVLIFRLPKDLTTTLISGYSYLMRHAIVTRWMELEAQQAPAPAAQPVDLTSAASLRGLLLGYTEQVLALEGRVLRGC